MVNTGRPSQGCGTCRARRIKVFKNSRCHIQVQRLINYVQCDEQKPTCFRCQKSKRQCTGYRNQLFLRRLGGKGSLNTENDVFESNGGTLYRTSPSKSITQITYRSTSSPETIVVSPPSYRLSTSSIEEEALCYFIKNFVLMPCKGNSRSYMDFVVPAMKDVKSLESPPASLPKAVMAVSLALFANRRRVKPLLAKAAKQYAKALQQINEALRHPERALEDETLATIIILGLFEV